MPLELTPVATIPANDSPPFMVRDLSIITTPKPPASRTSISPPGLVVVRGTAKVLHGLVRLQGLASSPTAETQVRFTVALIAQRGARKNPNKATHLGIHFCLFIMNTPFRSRLGTPSYQEIDSKAISSLSLVNSSSRPFVPSSRSTFLSICVLFARL